VYGVGRFRTARRLRPRAGPRGTGAPGMVMDGASEPRGGGVVRGEGDGVWRVGHRDHTVTAMALQRFEPQSQVQQ